MVPNNSRTFPKFRDRGRNEWGSCGKGVGRGSRRGRLRLAPVQVDPQNSPASGEPVGGAQPSSGTRQPGERGAGELFLGRPVGGSQSLWDAPGSFQVWEAFRRSGWPDPAEAGAHGAPGIAARGTRGLGFLSARARAGGGSGNVHPWHPGSVERDRRALEVHLPQSSPGGSEADSFLVLPVGAEGASGGGAVLQPPGLPLQISPLPRQNHLGWQCTQK